MIVIVLRLAPFPFSTAGSGFSPSINSVDIGAIEGKDSIGTIARRHPRKPR